MHRAKLFSEYCQGRGVPQNVKNVPVSQERHIFKTVQTESFSTGGHHTMQPCCARQGLYHRHKFWFWKILYMMELCSSKFITCGRISMLPAYSFATSVSDWWPAYSDVGLWFLLVECSDCSSRVAHDMVGVNCETLQWWLSILINVNDTVQMQGNDAGLITSERKHVRSSNLVGRQGQGRLFHKCRFGPKSAEFWFRQITFDWLPLRGSYLTCVKGTSFTLGLTAGRYENVQRCWHNRQLSNRRSQ